MRPFLENVTRGRGIPPERLDDVAEHYLHFGGVSPINGINRALIDELRGRGLDLPVYFGNRNWEPYVEDTVAAMRDNGIRRPRCSPRRRGAAIPAAPSTSRTSRGPGRPPATAHRSWSNCASTSTIRCSSQMFADAIAAAAHDRARTMRPAGVHRAFDPGARRLALRPRPLQPPGRLRRKACRGGRGLRRLRPGLAVALGSAAGAVAGTRRRRSPRGAGRAGTKAVIVCPDRVRRRPHRGGVGSRPRIAHRPRRRASRSRGRPRPTPTRVRPAGRRPDRRAARRPRARQGPARRRYGLPGRYGGCVDRRHCVAAPRPEVCG